MLVVILFGIITINVDAATIQVDCTNESLIDAINVANANREQDNLRLAEDCVYSLRNSHNYTALGGSNGLPLITSSINIDGNDSIIERSSTTSDKFRFFQVDPGAILSLSNITLQGGYGVGGVSDVMPLGASSLGSAPGGGAILTGGFLILARVNVLNNRTGNGAHDDNQLSNANGGDGGAIASYADSRVVIEHSIIDGNQTGNASFGNSGTGGALSFRGTSIVISRTTISNNRVGDVLSNDRRILSDIIVAFPSDRFRLSNSTISGNGAGVADNGILFNSSSLNDVTIAQNTFYGNSMSGALLSILNVADGSAIIKRNIFEQNSNANCFLAFRDLNQVESIGNIFDSSTDTCGVDTNSNFINEDANVLPLADNGGPTPTHFLPPNSPARDRLSSSSPTDETDQRFVEFGQDSNLGRSNTPVDIGAVEANSITEITGSINITNNQLVTGTQRDWYSVYLEKGESIAYTVIFSDSLGDVDTQFYLRNVLFSPLRESDSTFSDNETIEFVASEAGEYWFSVYGFRNATNTYDLNVRIERNELCLSIKARNGNVVVVCL